MSCVGETTPLYSFGVIWWGEGGSGGGDSENNWSGVAAVGGGVTCGMELFVVTDFGYGALQCDPSNFMEFVTGYLPL